MCIHDNWFYHRGKKLIISYITSELLLIRRGWVKYRDLLVVKQRIHLRDNDKSQYFAITELNNCFIIWRSSSLFSINIFFYSFGKASKAICHFYAREIPRGRKEWFHLRMSKILFATKKGTTLSMSRQLFVGIYLQVTWWALGQGKGRKVCIEW